VRVIGSLGTQRWKWWPLIVRPRGSGKLMAARPSTFGGTAHMSFHPNLRLELRGSLR
jgi:hypothetical protein